MDFIKYPMFISMLGMFSKTKLILFTMKTLIAFAIAVAAFPSAQASIIAQWDWNNLKGDKQPNTPSCVAPCVTTTDLGYQCLTEGFSATGGIWDSAYRTYSGWSEDFTASLNGRTDLSPANGTLWFDVTFDAEALGSIDSLDFCYRRIDAAAPSQMQASIFWQNDQGGVEWASTGEFSLGNTVNPSGDFTCFSLPFAHSSVGLPSGADLAGKTFHVEFHAWGEVPDCLPKDANGTLAVENLTLSGAAVCAIPEPGSALLIAAIGLVTMLRRHRPRTA